MRYLWIHNHREHWPVAWMCGALKVTRSGYYAWRDRPVCDRVKRRADLIERIRQIHRDSDRCYGSPRVHQELVACGEHCNVKTVAKLMRDNDLYSRTKRKFRITTTDSNHGYGVAPNLVDRRFDQAEPNRVWASDITYIPTLEGWMYLAVVIDLYSRKVVGYAMADHLRASLAIEALTMALDTRRPATGSWRDQRLIHHSDRGVQYACDAYQAVLEAHGITPSMSRTGNCYDNAVAESFIGTLKTELVHHERYDTRNQARQSIRHYIENFYNARRRHSKLGYVSPIDFEETAA